MKFHYFLYFYLYSITHFLFYKNLNYHHILIHYPKVFLQILMQKSIIRRREMVSISQAIFLVILEEHQSFIE